jgi:hypothetical protein
MLTQEEIRIKAGLDYSKVTAGLADIRRQVHKLANDVPRQLSNILKANVFAGAASIISELIPNWEEFWNKFYGTDEATMAKSKQANENIKNLARSVRDAQSDLAKTQAEIFFKNSPKGQQQFTLMGEEKALAEKQGGLKDTIKKWEDFKKVITEAMGEAFSGSDTQKKIMEGIAVAEREILEIEKQRAILQDKINNTFKDWNPAAGGDYSTPDSPHTDGMLEEAPPDRRDSVQRYMDNVKARNTNWQRHAAGMRDFGKPPAPDPLKLDETQVMKVKIVEVE